MNQPRIVLESKLNNVPFFFKDKDGRYSFDLSPDTSISLTKEIDEETDPSKLKQDSFKSIDIPFTKKNSALLGSFGNPTSLNFNHFKPFNVSFQWGPLNLENLQARILNLNSNGWTLNVRAETYNWIGQLSDLCLKDVDLGSFLFDQTWLDDNHQNRWIFTDGDDGVFMPLVNYGKWRIKDDTTDTNIISLEDYRFWFSPLNVLRESFCQIGWKFICPFLEGTYGRKLWVYLLADDWNQKKIDPLVRGFRAELTSPLFSPSVSTTKIIFDDDSVSPNFDTGGNYNNLTGEYSASVVGSFQAVIDIQFVDTLGAGNGVANDLIELEIRVQPVVGSSILVAVYAIPLAGSLFGQTITYTLNTGDIIVYATDDVYVNIVNILDSKYEITVTEGVFTVSTKSAPIQRGDTVFPALSIDPEHKALDFLKGITHLFSLKYETNPELKTVSFFPAEDAEIYFDEVVEGFFRTADDQSADYSSKIQVDSAKMELKTRTQKRVYSLAFQEDDDDWNISQLNLDDPFLSSVVDFGEEFQEGETVNRNPFFAPTININDTKIVKAKTIARAPYIPALWNGDSELGDYPVATTKIDPRICLALPYDFITKFTDFSELFGQKGGGRVEFEYEDGSTKQAMSLFGQVFPRYIFPEQAPYIADQGVNECIAYDPVQVRDDLVGTYEYFYKKAIKDYYYGFSIDFLVWLDLNDISNFTFRDLLKIQYNFKRFGTKTFYARVLKITDYVIGKDITTPVKVLPEVSIFDTEC